MAPNIVYHINILPKKTQVAKTVLCSATKKIHIHSTDIIILLTG